jgi:hypothetical protein
MDQVTVRNREICMAHVSAFHLSDRQQAGRADTPAQCADKAAEVSED